MRKKTQHARAHAHTDMHRMNAILIPCQGWIYSKFLVHDYETILSALGGHSTSIPAFEDCHTFAAYLNPYGAIPNLLAGIMLYILGFRADCLTYPFIPLGDVVIMRANGVGFTKTQSEEIEKAYCLVTCGCRCVCSSPVDKSDVICAQKRCGKILCKTCAVLGKCFEHWCMQF